MFRKTRKLAWRPRTRDLCRDRTKRTCNLLILGAPMAIESTLSLPEHTLRTGVRTGRMQQAEVGALSALIDPTLVQRLFLRLRVPIARVWKCE